MGTAEAAALVAVWTEFCNSVMVVSNYFASRLYYLFSSIISICYSDSCNEGMVVGFGEIGSSYIYVYMYIVLD